MNIQTTENLLSLFGVMAITNGDIVIVESSSIHSRYDSWVDGDVDRLVSDLMMYSLNHDITNVERTEYNGLAIVYIDLKETKSTTSNIEADVIDMLYNKLTSNNYAGVIDMLYNKLKMR